MLHHPMVEGKMSKSILGVCMQMYFIINKRGDNNHTCNNTENFTCIMNENIRHTKYLCYVILPKYILVRTRDYLPLQN